MIIINEKSCKIHVFIVQIIFISSVTAFILLAACVEGSTCRSIDADINGFFIKCRAPALVQIMAWISLAGGPFFLFVYTVFISAVLAIYGRIMLAGYFYIPLTVGWLMETNIKAIIGRPRPADAAIEATANGFPSGHASMSLIFFSVLLLLFYRWLDSGFIRMIMGIVICCSILAVGISRIYLGVHWLSDVFGGYFLGAATLCLYILLSIKWRDIVSDNSNRKQSL